MNRQLATAATTALLVGLFPTGTASAEPQEPAPAVTSPAVAVPDSNTNRALDFLARKLAVAVSSVEIRQLIHAGIQKRFDGDTNVLWSSLAEGSNFNGMVAAAASRGRANAEVAAQIDSSARSFPRLQIAVPEIFDSWNARDFVPLVAFVPEGIDDMEIATFTAYDSEGKTVLLDARVTPQNPVIVVSLNERTDENGKLKSTRPATTTSGTTEATALATTATRYEVGMIIVHLIHDMEPWAKGDAEISHAARTHGCSGTNYEDYNWVNLNHDDDWWAPGTRRVLGSTVCPVDFAWWEDDGGAWNWELEVKGLKFGIGMDDDDDMIGRVQLPYSSFQGASMEKYGDWSNLHMWTD